MHKDDPENAICEDCYQEKFYVKMKGGKNGNRKN